MTFFFDNSLSYRIAHGLREFGEEAVALRDVMPADTPDEVWIPDVGTRGWYVVHYDKRINTRPAEIRAFLDAGLGGFVFAHRRKLDRWDWVVLVVNRWTEIKRFAESTNPPFVYSIPERGRLRRLY